MRLAASKTAQQNLKANILGQFMRHQKQITSRMLDFIEYHNDADLLDAIQT